PTWAALERPARTWKFSRSTSSALFSGLSRLSSWPAGSLANAASVGANRVNGPLPWSWSTIPACRSALLKVLNEPLATAVSTTFLMLVVPVLLGLLLMGYCLFIDASQTAKRIWPKPVFLLRRNEMLGSLDDSRETELPLQASAVVQFHPAPWR